MATEFAERPVAAGATRSWSAGFVAGLAGGVGMGLLLQFGTGLLPLLGAIVGVPTPLGGWLFHLAVSVVFGLLFAFAVSRPILADYTSTGPEIVGLGVAQGALLAFVTGGVVLPLAVNPMRGTALPVPLLPIPGVAGELFVPFVVAVAHLVYGFLLGVTYEFLTSRR